MSGDLLKLVDQLFTSYGYWVVFIGLILEGITVVGALTPGEVTLVVAAAYAARGSFDPFLVWALASAGGVIGSVISYEIGKHGGLPVILRYGHRFGVSEERVAATREYFERHGAKTVFIGRWAGGIKSWIPALAGAADMPWPVFLVYTVAAAAAWSAMATALGYFFGANLGLVMRILKWLGWGVVGLVAVAAAIGWWRHRARQRREHELAVALEEELPVAGAGIGDEVLVREVLERAQEPIPLQGEDGDDGDES